MIISFCGHANFSKTSEYEKRLLNFFEENIGDLATDFYLGGYGEFDDFAYECCKKYKTTHLRVSLIFVTPYITVDYQKRHLKLQKERYDEIIYPGIEDKPLKLAICYRNKWMIEKADYFVCGISHEWGGAYKTYQHAKRKRKMIFNITGKEF